MIRLSELRSWPARLLAFARSTEPRRAPSGTAVGLDVLLACIAVIASLMVDGDQRGTGGWAAAVAVLATTTPLALRRVYPITVFWVVLLGIIIDSQQPTTFIMFVALLLAAYSAIVHSRFRGAAVLSVLLAGVMVTAAYSDTSIPQPGRFAAL